MLSEISQTKASTAWYHLYVESKKSNSYKESRKVVASNLFINSGQIRKRLVKGYNFSAL